MFDWFLSSKPQQNKEKVSFIVHQNSQLYIECTPVHPTTSSNINLTAFSNSSKHQVVPIRVQWFKSQYKQAFSNSGYQIQKIAYNKNNTYICEPSDLGCYLNAKIISLDDDFNPRRAQITIGPIKIDILIKTMMESAMFSKTLLSQITLISQEKQKSGYIRLNPHQLQIVQEQNRNKFYVDYNISQPKLQIPVNKDPQRLILKFANDDKNKISQFIEIIFQKYGHSTQYSKSLSNSKASSKSKDKFLSNHQVLEIKFQNRNARDIFIFIHKAFICKDMMKNSIVFEKMEKMLLIDNEQSFNKFIQFVGVKSQTVRLSGLCNELQRELTIKQQQFKQLQKLYMQISLKYTKIIQSNKKSYNSPNSQNSKSYIQINPHAQQSRNRLHSHHEHINRKLIQQNDRLKIKIQQIQQQLQLRNHFKCDQSSIMPIQNNTNQLIKRQSDNSNNLLNNSIRYEQQQMNNNKFLQLSQSYAKIYQQNEEIKKKLAMEASKTKQLQMKLIQNNNRQMKNTQLFKSKSISDTNNNFNEDQKSIINILDYLPQQNNIEKLQQQCIKIKKQRDYYISLLKQVKDRENQWTQRYSILEANQHKKYHPIMIKNNLQIKKINEENKTLKQQIIKLKMEANFIKDSLSAQVHKLKNINKDIYEQNGYLKKLIEQNQVSMNKYQQILQQNSFIKSQNNSQNNQMHQQLNNAIGQLQKYKYQLKNKENIIKDQIIEIQNLQTTNNELTDKIFNLQQKSKLEMSCTSDADKYKKKIKSLQQQIAILRRSADVLNRSKDLSMDMSAYYQEKMQSQTRQIKILLQNNQSLTKMCEAYAKDAREYQKMKKIQLQKKIHGGIRSSKILDNSSFLDKI